MIDWSGVQIANSTLKGFVAVHLAVGPTGDVLMWDREDGLTSAKRWDPNTGAFTNAANAALPTALFCAFQTRLPGGKLIVVGGTALKKGAGGSELAGTGLDQARIYDWATGAWSTAASMHTPRWYPTVVALPDGRQVVMGGQVKKGVMATLSEVYNPANNTWTELPGLAEAKTLGTYPRAILAPNGKIFMIKNGSGKSAFMDVDTQTWTTVGKPPPAPGGGGMAMYDNGKILMFAVSSNASDSYVIDLNAAKPAWRKVGSLHFARKKFSTVILPDGRVMAIGGSSDGQGLDSHAVLTPEIWDPATEVWSTLPNIAVPRMYHSNAILLPSGQVLSAGGGRAPGWTDYPSAQLYSPDYLAQPNRPVITGRLESALDARRHGQPQRELGQRRRLGRPHGPADGHPRHRHHRTTARPADHGQRRRLGHGAGPVDQLGALGPLLRDRPRQPGRAQRGEDRAGRRRRWSGDGVGGTGRSGRRRSRGRPPTPRRCAEGD